MEGNRRGILSLVLVPALLTLVVTVLRLVGQLNQWSPTWFGRPQAGGSGALLGISWLMFVFGLWFGRQLQRSGNEVRSPGKALLISLVAAVVTFGGGMALQAADLVWFPDAEHPGEPRGLVYMLGLLLLGCAICAVAWWRAALTMLVYAILARIPVIVVSWLAIENGWDTHYTKIAPGFPQPAEGELLTFLVMPQITFWPAITVIFGTLMACLGALLSGKPKAA